MVLTYKIYNVRARFGPSDITPGNPVYEYADRVVDFSTFQMPALTYTGAVSNFIASSVVLAAGLLALLN